MSALVLQALLGSFPVERFLADHWTRAPLFLPEGARALAPLASWARLSRMLADPALDLLLVRDGRVAPERPADEEAARAALATGHTLAFRHLERTDDAFASLGRRLGGELQAAPNVHVYRSPAGHGSFGWHCDPEEVLLFQLEGTKRYRLRANTRHPAPLAATLSRAGRAGDEAGPIASYRLEPGACLYIPGGTWHDAAALADATTVSLGLLPRTPIDLLDFLRSELLDDPRWRARMPPGAGDEDRLAAWRALRSRMVTELAERLEDEALLRRFLRAGSDALTPSRRPPA